MEALGLYGKGKKSESKKIFELALSKKPNYFQLIIHDKMLFEE